MKDLPIYKDQFGADYDLGIELDMTRWTDISYNSSWCACFAICAYVEGYGSVSLRIWIDYEDKDKREFSSSPRYAVEIDLSNSIGNKPEFFTNYFNGEATWTHFYDTECSVKIKTFLDGIL